MEFINGLIDDQNYKGIIALEMNSFLPVVAKAKAISFVRLELYDDCLQFISSSRLENFLSFEEAYCLYKTNRQSDALSVINLHYEITADDSIKYTTDIHWLLLKAQVCYRLEDFDQALEIYEGMPDQTPDIESNIIAVKAGKASCGGDVSLQSSYPTTYSALFNLATYKIAQGDLNQALDILEDSAGMVSQQMIDDGYDENDVARELLVIVAQKAFIQQQLGQNELAIENYNTILSSQNLDPVIKAIASSNLISITQDRNLDDITIALNSINTPSILAKLNTSQISKVERNNLLLSRMQDGTISDRMDVDTDVVEVKETEKKVKAVRKKKKKSKPIPKNADLKLGPDPNRWKAKASKIKPTSVSQGAATVAGGGLGSTGSAKLKY